MPTNPTRWRKFTVAQIEDFVSESKSYKELARKLGYPEADSNGTISSLKKMIKELNLDISHFSGAIKEKK